MVELLTQEPWLVVCMLVALVIVSCVAIVFLTDYVRSSRQAEIDAGLKQLMIERGMSAAEIKIVLEANTYAEANNQPVRVGLGKFHVEVGGVKPAADAARG
jgi:hypothetical protein